LSIHHDCLGHGGTYIDAGEEKSRSRVFHAGLAVLPQPRVSTNASTLVLIGASDLSL
jgi:hypothetical protein